MSCSSHNFYPDLSFGSYLVTKLGERNTGSYQSSDAVIHMSDEYGQLKHKETESVFNKDMSMLQYAIKIEEANDNYYPATTERSNNNLQYDSSLTDRYSLYQAFSPCPSYSTHSSLDLRCNESNNNGALDYFMSSSPSTTYSLLTTPDLSQENFDLCYNESVNLNYFDYQYLATDYPLGSTETIPYYDTPTIDTTTHNKPLVSYKSNNNGTKIGFKKCKRTTTTKSPESSNPVINESFTTDDINAAHKKTYPCNYCSRSFSRRYDVTRHERTHTGVKPYVCPCCLKGFSRSDARVRHFRTEIACRDGADRLGRQRTQKLHKF